MFLCAVITICLNSSAIRASSHINTPIAQSPVPAPQDSLLPDPTPIPMLTPIPVSTPIVMSAPTPVPLTITNPGNEDEVLISFAGDCTLGTDPDFAYRTSLPAVWEKNGKDFSYFYKNVKPVFASDDLTLVNLETTLTTARIPAEKRFQFKGPPEFVNILKEGSIEAVNIANNHIRDYLDTGFQDTREVLEQAAIAHSGWEYIAFLKVGNLTVASIGFTGWDGNVKKKVREAIAEARKKAQIVLVSFHWGQERVYYPSAFQKELGRFCIDEGADAVIGHHPHVIQGIECYQGRYIAYSLGNFCFGGNSNPTDKDSLILQNRFRVREGKVVGVEAEILPCSISSAAHINNYQPTLLSGSEKERVMKRLEKYSSKLEYGITCRNPGL